MTGYTFTYHTEAEPIGVFGKNPKGHKAESGQTEKKALNYSTFGSLMTERTYSAGGYRYGFNSMEMDDEVKGVGNSLDFGARIYDSRLGRWLSLDPLKEKYPFASPYNFALNTPIQAFDPDGRLVVFVNGFMFDQWATSNRGEYTTFDGAHVTIPHRPYPTFEMSTGSRPVYLGQEFNYWSGVDDAFMERFEDHNSLYLSGSDRRASSANERFNAGKQSGIELLQKIQNGEITLEKEETIKIVAHSQGAAHAAGMAQVLNQAFKDGVLENPVEQIYYLAPHQPGDFATPEGIFSAQYSRESDKVSSRGLISSRGISGGSTFSEIKNISFFRRLINMTTNRGGHDVDTFIEIFDLPSHDGGYVRPKVE
jgi:RHS repeat-associated protein